MKLDKDQCYRVWGVYSGVEERVAVGKNFAVGFIDKRRDRV